MVVDCCDIQYISEMKSHYFTRLRNIWVICPAGPSPARSRVRR
jgi:hypothetical protein